jgi:hypothetical protein
LGNQKLELLGFTFFPDTKITGDNHFVEYSMGISEMYLPMEGIFRPALLGVNVNFPAKIY